MAAIERLARLKEFIVYGLEGPILLLSGVKLWHVHFAFRLTFKPWYAVITLIILMLGALAMP